MARTACLEAGKIIMSYWKRDFQISDKGGSSPSTSIVTEVDRKAQDKIISILAPSLERYDLGLLAEESDDNKTRFEKEFFWAIDPLDGTLYFSDGKSGFAVSIAFVDKGGMPVLGVVYDPVSKRVFHAIKDQGTFCNGERIYTSPDKVEKTIFFADRSIKNSPNYSELKEKFDIRFSGGSVMNAINVLTHPNAFYLKYPKQETGGCAVWDLAATSLILEEAGGSMTGHNGEKLNFNPNDSVFFNKTGLLCSHHKFPQTFP
jgi:3'(2'), 5'-bisphosphate nucleotidase